MSHLAASEVARNVSQALEMLRRPANDFGRDFLLATGHDPQGDLVMLSNPIALAHASTATATGFQVPPEEAFDVDSQGADGGTAGKSNALDRSQGVADPVSVVYTMVPSMCVGVLTCGVAVQRLRCPVVTRGRTTYSMGRFLRDESTGETLIVVCFAGPDVSSPPYLPRLTWFHARLQSTALASMLAPQLESDGLVYFRHVTSTSRFHLVAFMVPGVSVRDVYATFLDGDPAKLSANFCFCGTVIHTREGGCPECKLPASADCSCDLSLTPPRSALDFASFPNNSLSHMGRFCGTAALSLIFPATQSSITSSAGGGSDSGTTQQSAPALFVRLPCPPEVVDCRHADSSITSLLAQLAIQDRIQLANPCKLAMPTPLLGSPARLLEAAVGEAGPTWADSGLFAQTLEPRPQPPLSALEAGGHEPVLSTSIPLGLCASDYPGTAPLVDWFGANADGPGDMCDASAYPADVDTTMFMYISEDAPGAATSFACDRVSPGAIPPEDGGRGGAGAATVMEEVLADASHAEATTDVKKLARQEKNRVAAARSNARRKVRPRRQCSGAALVRGRGADSSADVCDWSMFPFLLLLSNTWTASNRTSRARMRKCTYWRWKKRGY
jgi:hypothetical protein